MKRAEMRAEAIAYLNKCFEQGISWNSAKDYVREKLHCSRSTICKYRQFTKYNENTTRQ